MQSRIKALRGLTLSLDSMAFQEAVALRNRSFADSFGPAGQSMAPSNVVVAAIVITPKLTGVFRVDIDYGFHLSTGSLSVSLDTHTKTAAFPANLTNGTAVGTSSYFLNADALGNAANGLQFGGGTTDTTPYSPTVGVGAAADFSIHLGGMFSGFTAGNNVAFAVKITSNGGAVVSAEKMTLSAYEMP